MAHGPRGLDASTAPACAAGEQGAWDPTMEQELRWGPEGWKGGALWQTMRRGPLGWPREGLGEPPRASGGRRGAVGDLQGCSSATGAQLCVHAGCGGGTRSMQETAVFLIQLWKSCGLSDSGVGLVEGGAQTEAGLSPEAGRPQVNGKMRPVVGSCPAARLALSTAQC